MLIYLLKSGACLAIFMAFYTFFLERENMHKIKRYYLLSALIIAFAIPLVTFTHFIEVTPFRVVNEPAAAMVYYTEDNPQITETNYLSIILWTIYGAGVLLCGTKFSINLLQIIFKIKRNPKQKSKDIIHVLLADLVTPHTFFKYIFLNKQKFENHEIPQAVFWHEETHARQKHSIDVLFVELLQVIFWFNPLIYFAKRSIKMNHEFLADQAVLNKGISASNYQHILLAFSSDVAEPQLANAINYSSIKKRFTVMKTQTSKRNIWLRSILLLPLLALTLYGFSEKREVVRETNQDPTPTLFIHHEPFRLELNGKITNLKDIKNDFLQITNGSISDLNIESNEVVKMSLLDSISKLLRPNLSTISIKSDFGITGDRPLDASKRTKQFAKNTPLIKVSNVVNLVCDHCTIEREMLASSTIVTSDDDIIESFKIKFPSQKELNIQGNSFNNEVINLINLLEDNQTIQIFDIRTKTGIIDGEMLVSFKTKQQKATPEELAEYNKLAKHYNSQAPEKTIIRQKDIERMQYLYDNMSKSQKANAQPFPIKILPPPPPPPPAPKDNTQTQIKTGFVAANGEKLYYVENTNGKTYYNRGGNEVDKNGKKLNGNVQVNASDVIPGQYITKVFSDNKLVVEFKNDKNIKNSVVNIPSPPPPPKSPLNHVKEMMKKNAVFFYNEKAISGDEAIGYLKNNKELSICTKQMDTEQPEVYISTEPITVESHGKSKEPVMVNGKKAINDVLTLTRAELIDATLSINDGRIISFKFKIPGKPTQSINGNTIDAETKALIKETLKNDMVQMFMIKNSNDTEHPPIMISIKE